MSNIEKIRQEIERRKKVYLTKNGFPRGTFGAIKIETYEGLLDFIDSLPEETCKDSLEVPETCKENADSFTEDLEEAADDYQTTFNKTIGPFYHDDQKRAFIAGAEWQKEQKPAEWSEEDEEILKLLILNIGRYKYFGGMSSERILAFLKSLRPQPHWKPSEEQMKDKLNSL